MLTDPPLNVALTPNTALRERRYGLRKACGSGELVGSLLADSEQLSDLGGAGEIHRRSVTDALDNVKGGRHTSLDSVKGAKMQTSTRTDRYVITRLERALAALEEIEERIGFDAWNNYEWDSVSSARQAISERIGELRGERS